MNYNSLTKVLSALFVGLFSNVTFGQDTDSSELNVTASVRAAAAVNCEEPVDFGKLVILDTNSTNTLQVTLFESNGAFTASMNSNGASHSGGAFGLCTVTAPGADSTTKTITLTFPTSNSAFQAFDIGPSTEYQFALSAIDPSGNTLQSNETYDTDSVTSQVQFKGAVRCDNGNGNCNVRGNLAGDYSSTVDVDIAVADSTGT